MTSVIEQFARTIAAEWYNGATLESLTDQQRQDVLAEANAMAKRVADRKANDATGGKRI